MKNLWNVQMPWAWSGDPCDEEGTYTTVVPGANPQEAKLNAAIEMADSGEKEMSGAGQRERYIESRMHCWADVYPQVEQIKQDLASTYADELFPDGVAREINLQALGRLLAEHRSELLEVQSNERSRPRAA
jgi:hypothetical protein